MIKSPMTSGTISAVCVLLSIISTPYAASSPSSAQSRNEKNTQTRNATATRHETPQMASLTADLNPRSLETVPRTITASENTSTATTQTFTATAYCLRGRTASGRMVARGLIAADPRVLPLGTRVLLSAGAHSGEYTVADTGGAVRGRLIDIWVPSSGEAMRFGRRSVRLTVLQYGGRRGRTRSPVASR